MHLSLDISDSKAKQFVEFLKTLDFVQINEDDSDIVLPEWHKSILEERLEAYNKNPENVKDAREMIKGIKKRL
jgi:hypothetical protein